MRWSDEQIFGEEWQEAHSRRPQKNGLAWRPRWGSKSGWLPWDDEADYKNVLIMSIDKPPTHSLIQFQNNWVSLKKSSPLWANCQPDTNVHLMSHRFDSALVNKLVCWHWKWRYRNAGLTITDYDVDFCFIREVWMKTPTHSSVTFDKQLVQNTGVYDSVAVRIPDCQPSSISL